VLTRTVIRTATPSTPSPSQSAIRSPSATFTPARTPTPTISGP
jgi:hypothetical protein